MADNKTVNVYLVAAGQFHDIDFARLELLKLLAEDDKIRVQVAADYHDLESIGESDFLISYTCNLVPTEAEQQALADYIHGGKRWIALHGTNSILKFLPSGKVEAPETAPILMKTLGTQFLAHPPIQMFKVTHADAEHPLVKGVPEFETDDELYLCRIHGDLHTLLETRFTGKANGFLLEQWDDDEPRPVYYINKVGDGEVLYLNLGHCRGHYDMQPMMDYYPAVERGSWERQEYYELLRRAIRYCSAGI
ncbi:MAG: ThuA domain-containing protein [Proteobacteria bacterium]|nr:ThuA domain-containing protein [Pseudomonadota bacterium]